MTQETTHTPEPWLLVKQANSNLCGARCDSSNWFLFEDALERDAARIVACVNACAGMADPAAEIAALRAESESNYLLRMDIEEKENLIVEYHTEVESLKQRIAELEKEAGNANG